MKIFLDTSSLFKLYHEEDGTEELEKIQQEIPEWKKNALQTASNQSEEDKKVKQILKEKLSQTSFAKNIKENE